LDLLYDPEPASDWPKNPILLSFDIDSFPLGLDWPGHSKVRASSREFAPPHRIRTDPGTNMSAMASLQMAGAPLVARRGSAKKASKALRRAMRCNAATAEETEAKLITYPFVKLIGQDELKLALTLNVIVSTPHLSRMSPRRPPTPDRIIHYPQQKEPHPILRGSIPVGGRRPSIALTVRFPFTL
jgi:hypothetical protein